MEVYGTNIKSVNYAMETLLQFSILIYAGIYKKN